MLASFLVLFRLVAVVTPLCLLMKIPLALHRLVLAVWLIAKGFDLSALDGTTSVKDAVGAPGTRRLAK